MCDDAGVVVVSLIVLLKTPKKEISYAMGQLTYAGIVELSPPPQYYNGDVSE
jgi:hypothetical protein